MNNIDSWTTEVRYLITLLVATAISILSFRKNSIDEKIKQVTVNFQRENSEINKVFRGVQATNARSKRVAISWMISERILDAREDSAKIFKKEKSKISNSLERISQECLDRPVIVSFIIFLGILSAVILQSGFDKLDGNHHALIIKIIYIVSIFLFLGFVLPWPKYTLFVIGIPLILPLLISIFNEWIIIPKILKLILPYLPCAFFVFWFSKDVLSKPKLNGMNYIYEMMSRSRKLALLFYLFFIYFLSNAELLVPIFCIIYLDIKELLFYLAPLNIFVYFLITIIFLYSFARKLKLYLKRVFEYLVLEHFRPKNSYIENVAMEEDYLNRLQIFVASDLEGLLLRKIQVDYEDKEY